MVFIAASVPPVEYEPRDEACPPRALGDLGVQEVSVKHLLNEDMRATTEGAPTTHPACAEPLLCAVT